MAIEEAPYKVVNASGMFEVRDYEPHVIAETLVDGTLENAGNKAFRRLFNYISGANHSRSAIAMTAPVSQQRSGEKITMTAPMSLEPSAGKWAVSFMMPAKYRLATLPVPDDKGIMLRQVPARRTAAVRYSGTWSGKNYLHYKEGLEKWMRENGLEVGGEPVWARYNPPFALWFLRRNEILIPVKEIPDHELERSVPTARHGDKPRMRAPRFPLKVFYDGACIVCATEIGHYLRKDHGQKLVAIDISTPDFDPVPYRISLADFMHHMHAIDQDGQVFKGVDSFWAIWQLFPASTIYGIMGRVIQLPRVNRLARIGYWLFARVRPYLPKRHQCDSGTCSIHQRK